MKQPSTQLRVDCRNEEKMLHYCMVHRTSHVTARKNNTKQHSWSNNKNQKEKWIRSLMQIWWKSFLFSVFSEEQTEKLFPLTFSSPHQLMAGQAEKQIDEVNRCQVPPLRVKLCRLSPHFFLLFLFSVMCVHNAFSGCAQIVEPASECDGLVHTCDVDAETFFSPLAGDSHYREKKKIAQGWRESFRRNRRMDHVFSRRSIDTISMGISARFFFPKYPKVLSVKTRKPHFSLLIAFASPATSSFGAYFYMLWHKSPTAISLSPMQWDPIARIPGFRKPPTYPNRSAQLLLLHNINAEM